MPGSPCPQPSSSTRFPCTRDPTATGSRDTNNGQRHIRDRSLSGPGHARQMRNACAHHPRPASHPHPASRRRSPGPASRATASARMASAAVGVRVAPGPAPEGQAPALLRCLALEARSPQGCRCATTLPRVPCHSPTPPPRAPPSASDLPHLRWPAAARGFTPRSAPSTPYRRPAPPYKLRGAANRPLTRKSCGLAACTKRTLDLTCPSPTPARQQRACQPCRRHARPSPDSSSPPSPPSDTTPAIRSPSPYPLCHPRVHAVAGRHAPQQCRAGRARRPGGRCTTGPLAIAPPPFPRPSVSACGWVQRACPPSPPPPPPYTAAARMGPPRALPSSLPSCPPAAPLVPSWAPGCAALGLCAGGTPAAGAGTGPAHTPTA